MHVPARTSGDLIENATGNQYDGMLRVAEGTSFLSLDDRQAVFSESAQQIYALNHTAAHIWCRLEEHRTPRAIIGDLIESGLNPRLATHYVHQAVHAWLRLGLLRIDYGFGQEPLHWESPFTADMGKLKFIVHATSKTLAQRLIPLFGDRVAPADGSDDVFHIAEMGRLIHVFHNRLNVMSCAAAELAPTFKTYITEQIVARSPPDVVFHAACLARGGRSILISGAPGAGKTTLTLHLLNAGFEYRSDDIVLISPDGDVTGARFAPTVKSGAWEIIERIHPELSDLPIHRRLDGKRVRYLKPSRVARDNSYPVGWIVFIRRNSRAEVNLKPLGRIDALGRLLKGSFSPSEKLTQAAFDAIKQILVNANSFELTYSEATQACDTIISLCNA